MMRMFFAGICFFLSLQAAQAAPKAVVIDVRTPAEFAEVHVVGARNIDFRDPGFEDQIRKLDREGHYKVYCRSGNRSGQAEKLMKSLGFKHVENIGSVKEAARHLGQGCEGKSSSC